MYKRQPLTFDQNEISQGTAISHTGGDTDFTIQEPGLYYVSFHGSVSSVSGQSFPQTISLYLQPVSYTHLDVYKRQAKRGRIAANGADPGLLVKLHNNNILCENKICAQYVVIFIDCKTQSVV